MYTVIDSSLDLAKIKRVQHRIVTVLFVVSFVLAVYVIGV